MKNPNFLCVGCGEFFMLSVSLLSSCKKSALILKFNAIKKCFSPVEDADDGDRDKDDAKHNASRSGFTSLRTNCV